MIVMMCRIKTMEKEKIIYDFRRNFTFKFNR